jgi:trk system potassium uptake protein
MRVQGQRPGDVRIRVTRTRPAEYEVKPPKKLRRPTPPAIVLILAFLVMIAVGTVVLMLPISSQSREWTDPLTALFIATSAVCVTGLVVVDTGSHWSGFGQIVILLLIQSGGFGIMAGSTLLLQFVLRRGSRLSDRVRVQESTGVPQLGDVTRVIRRVALFTFALEATGAVILGIAFYARGAVGDPIAATWWGIFHSISAFNNAGFDLVGGFRSLGPFFDDWIILGTVGALLVIGGLGFAIVADAAVERRWQRLALETKIVLATTAVLLFGGAVVIGALEWNNPETLALYPEVQRPLNALFESATLRTAGFSVLDTGALLEPSLFVVMALMFIGGASGSTAGGIKINTFSLLLLTIISTGRGEPSVTAFGRRVKHELIYRAMAVALLAIAFLFVVGLLLTLTTDFSFVQVLFETVSALGTVGASTGITPQLDAAAQLIVIVAMFAGRLGPLTLVLALAARQRPVAYRPAVESIRIG